MPAVTRISVQLFSRYGGRFRRYQIAAREAEVAVKTGPKPRKSWNIAENRGSIGSSSEGEGRLVITEYEKKQIQVCAQKYGARLVVLFGSSVDRDDGRDIDLAVDGVEPGVFFEFYGDLIKRLSRPVDLVDLTADSAFGRLILETGVKLYGAA